MEASVFCTPATPPGVPSLLHLIGLYFFKMYLYVSQTGLELIVILLSHFPSLLEMETNALYH